MATCQKRGEKWRAIVRKKGHRPFSKAFRTKAAAKRWAQDTEDGIESLHVKNLRDLESITIGALITRYLVEFEPKRTKLGSLRILKEGLGKFHLTGLQPFDIGAHCKKRRARDGVAPSKTGSSSTSWGSG